MKKTKLKITESQLEIIKKTLTKEVMSENDDFEQEGQVNEQFANINFIVDGRAFITGQVRKEDFNKIQGGQKIQGVIKIAVNSYEDGKVIENPNLAVFLEYVYNYAPEGSSSYLNLYRRGESVGPLLDNVDENFKQYIRLKLIKNLDTYSKQKISELIGENMGNVEESKEYKKLKQLKESFDITFNKIKRVTDIKEGDFDWSKYEHELSDEELDALADEEKEYEDRAHKAWINKNTANESDDN